MISVVIPTFNRQDVLPVALASVLGQSYRDLEVVIADDGSTDNTEAIIQDLIKADNRIRYFRQPNAGVSAARNFGAAQARGEYLFFFDSDDVLLEGTLDVFAARIAETKADVLFSSCELIRDGVKKIKAPYDLGGVFKHVRGLFLAGTFCVRRALFQKTGGYVPGLKFGENFELGLRICQAAQQTAVVDFISMRYAIETETRVSSAYVNKVNSNLYILKEHKALLEQDRSFYAVILSQTGYLYRAMGNRPEARKYFLKSFFKNPLNLRNVYRFLVNLV